MLYVGLSILAIMIGRLVWEVSKEYRLKVKLRKLHELQKKSLRHLRNMDDYFNEAWEAWENGDYERSNEYATYSNEEADKIQQINDEFWNLQRS